MSSEKVIAVAGNPNVGKSTVFNNLTKSRQHTGNWPGKTVSNAVGYCSTEEYSYKLVDIPGTYSLLAHSAEEEVARDFICFGDADAVVVVCDATCLERNLNLVLQTMEITDQVIICVNLLDEAEKKGISVNLDVLSEELGVPVVGMVARDKKGLDDLLKELDEMMHTTEGGVSAASVEDMEYWGHSWNPIRYPDVLEQALSILEPAVKKVLMERESLSDLEKNKKCRLGSRWLSLKFLDYDETLGRRLKTYLGKDLCEFPFIKESLLKARKKLDAAGLDKMYLEEEIVSSVMHSAEQISGRSVECTKKRPDEKDRKIDRILTGRLLGYPIMAAMLMGILWLTIVGANYPSQILSDLFSRLQNQLTSLFQYMGAPAWLHGMLVLGIYRVLAWVISVMLPPMAIFFPLFTLLEDAGYLPRIAYNLDKPFQKCCACGKQALTMSMGFGCNAVGVTGCRIIDSPRERLIAVLTNCFVPCNGRFPPPYKGKQNCSSALTMKKQPN